jgi:hypothetical protein
MSKEDSKRKSYPFITGQAQYMTILGIGSTWYSVFRVPVSGRTTCTDKYQVVGLPLNLTAHRCEQGQ